MLCDTSLTGFRRAAHLHVLKTARPLGDKTLYNLGLGQLSELVFEDKSHQFMCDEPLGDILHFPSQTTSLFFSADELSAQRVERLFLWASPELGGKRPNLISKYAKAHNFFVF